MSRLIFFVLLIFSFDLNSKYTNTNGMEVNKSIKDLIRWQRNQQKPIISSIEISDEWRNIDLINDTNYLIWIGHSTFLIKKDDFVILTDPVFYNRASPFKRFGPKRLIPPSITLNELPPIDVVTISHNHYDHLDIRSLKKISLLNPNVTFLIPIGDKDLFEKRNIKNVIEFEWWESKEFDSFEFIFTPVQHWSARGLFDRNDSLWGGWFVKGNEYSIDAEQSFGMHWGTFTLTAEDTLEPPIRLKDGLKRYPLKNFKTLIPGEIIRIE